MPAELRLGGSEHPNLPIVRGKPSIGHIAKPIMVCMGFEQGRKAL